ncbi:hypothetical protein C2G38_2037564 [Gigaspora rosea]|uniref:Uncharacterized protein n=1 Tax=Gigaspora rosea TaxID=44941 RepID=A0A397V9N6_9GLOM|nr:hypothetical protein C2G38_2037564 [Gigaspora rosea]
MNEPGHENLSLGAAISTLSELYRSNINKYEYGNNQYASILGSLASSEDHMLYELSTNEYYYKNTQHASIPHYLTLSEAHVIVLILFYHIRFFMNGSNMNEYGYENTQHASISDTSALLEVHVVALTF